VYELVEGKCPICGARIEIEDGALPGEIVECNSCSAQLEVFMDNGRISLKLLEQIGEDWGE
jgi:alpha-aminoadipate carrier protein LysW